MTTPAITPQRTGYVDVEGKPIYWELFGEGERETACLLNGLAMSTRSWYGFVPLLAEFDVLLFDYWGQGNSYSEDDPYSIPCFCDGLAKILNVLALQRIHIMGISYGGFIALEFARLYQERLHTMTLSGILLTHEELFEMYEDISLRFYRSGQMELYAHYMYEKIFGETFVRKLAPKLPEMRQKLIDRYGSRAYCLTRLTLAQDELFNGLDAKLDAYKAIQPPTLILAAEYDRVIAPHVQRKICDILPHTRFEIIEDCGHVAYLERPDVFFPRLLAFMRTKSLVAADAAGR